MLVADMFGGQSMGYGLLSNPVRIHAFRRNGNGVGQKKDLCTPFDVLAVHASFKIDLIFCQQAAPDGFGPCRGNVSVTGNQRGADISNCSAGD